MSPEFQLGGCYIAIPCDKECQQRMMAVVVGRQGMRLQIALVGDMTTATADGSIGHEFAQFDHKSDDPAFTGRYTISVAQQIDSYQAAEVNAILNRGRIVP